MKRACISISTILFILQLSMIHAQKDYRTFFHYLDPLPESKMVSPLNTIAFKLTDKADDFNNRQISVIMSGSKSGIINGKLHYISEDNIYIFKPENRFRSGEEIHCNITLRDNINHDSYSFKFSVSNTPLSLQYNVLKNLYTNKYSNKPPGLTKQTEINYDINDSLPDNFPPITVTDWISPSEGYYFVSAWYLIIFDNYGTPVFYRETHHGAHDFKILSNGQLSFFSPVNMVFYLMNDKYEITDTLGAGNGYQADLHELRKLENGHSFLLAYDPQIVDMSEIVEGGNPEAVVIGLIVQELNDNEEVVFQWRSWDHYQITDALNWVDLTEEQIDYVHGNSIEIERDSTLLISSRYLNEITKIDRRTGDIVWRLGGENNMFEFINDTLGFSLQHSIRLMPDSTNISLFDNGNAHSPQFSSAVEYALDDTNFTATLINRFRANPDIYGPWMGNTQRLQNGNAINGWGEAVPSVTEFDSAGNILAQFSFPVTSYRAFKFNWTLKAITFNLSEINYDTVYYDTFNNIHVNIENNLSEDIEINYFHHHDSHFDLITELPITIGQGQSHQVEIQFTPNGDEGSFDDILTFCWDAKINDKHQRIAGQIRASAFAVSGFGMDEKSMDLISVYPNPLDHFCYVDPQGLNINITGIDLFDSYGKLVLKETIGTTQKFRFNTVNLSSGVYILLIKTESGQAYRKLIKL